MILKLEDGSVITTTQIVGQRRGYYLVRQSDGQRTFISNGANEAELEKVCKKVLSNETGWDYWIDYSLGLDVDGKPAWINIDQTDAFL